MLLRVRPVLTFLIAALVFFFIAGFISYGVISSKSSRGMWKGYYQLVYPQGNSGEKTVELLKKNGFTGIISKDSEKVTVFSFSGRREIPLSGIPDYFVPVDPLYDHYLKTLGRYFTGTYGTKKVQVLYLPADASPLSTYMRLHSVLKTAGIWWKFINFVPIRKVFLFLILFAGEFLIFKLADDKRMFWISLVSWMVPFMFGGFLSTAASLGFQFLWIMLFNRFIPFYSAYVNYRTVDRTEGLKIIVEGILYFIVSSGMLIVMRGAFPLVDIVLPQIVQLFGTAALFGYIFFQQGFRTHKLFSPVVIKERWKCFKINEVYAVGLFFILFLIAPFVYWISFTGKNLTVAEPYAVVGKAALSYQTLQELNAVRGDSTLPDLSDYLSHRAFLDSFMYGGSFALPPKGSSVSLSVFRTSEGFALRENSTIKLFTDSWYKRIMGSVSKSTIPGMLLKQGAPLGVRYINGNRISQGEGNLRKYYLFFTFLMFPFLFWAGIGFTFPDGKIKRLFIRRRRQVV